MEQRVTVSDKAFEEAVSGGLLTREKHRAIKQFSRKEMERYIASIYKSGFEDGCGAIYKAVQDEAAAKHSNPEDEYEEVKADWEDVLRLIGEVKGTTPELLADIDRKLRDAF